MFNRISLFFNKILHKKEIKLFLIIIMGGVASVILLMALVLILKAGKEYNFLSLNWVSNINYEVVALKAAMINAVQIAIIFLIFIFRRHKVELRSFRLKSIIILIYIHQFTIISFITEFVNPEFESGNIYKFIGIIGFILMFYYVYIMIRTFDFIFDKLENEERLAKRLYRLSYTDKLTELPNRAYLFSQYDAEIPIHKENKFKMGVLFLDLDGFKKINDTFGHDIGDGVLIEVGKRLLNSVREVDIVTRIGGDEFVILVTCIEDELVLEEICKRIIKSMDELIYIGKHNITIGASIGISVYPKDGTKLEELLKSSDEALYMVKNKGKNNYKFYHNSKN